MPQCADSMDTVLGNNHMEHIMDISFSLCVGLHL